MVLPLPVKGTDLVDEEFELARRWRFLSSLLLPGEHSIDIVEVVSAVVGEGLLQDLVSEIGVPFRENRRRHFKTQL